MNSRVLVLLLRLCWSVSLSLGDSVIYSSQGNIFRLKNVQFFYPDQECD